MTIFLGSSTINPDASVTITAPAGFDSVTGLRLTNYTPSILIVTDVDSNDPGQQYLLPLQQNVYRIKNQRKLATLQDISTGAVIATNGVLVEWTNDYVKDFGGLQYPVTVTTGGLAVSGLDVNNLPLVDSGEVYKIDANPFRTSLQIYNNSGGDVRWSSVNGGWNNRPIIATGQNRKINSSGDVFLQPQADNLYVEVIAETVTPILL